MPNDETTIQTIQDSHTVVPQIETDVSATSVVSTIQTSDTLETTVTVTSVEHTVQQQIIEVSIEQTTLEHTVVFSAWYAGVGLPTGWTAWQVPIKQSNVDYDIEWEDLPPGWVTSFNSRTGAVMPASWDYALADITWLTAALLAKENAITAWTTSQYWRGDKSFQTLDKTAVGLGNVDNTSDANKPVSTAQATAIGLMIPLTQKAQALWVATLDSGGKILSSQIPVLAISEYLGVFSTTTTALANAGVQASQRWDWLTVNTNWGETWIVTTDSPTTLSHITKVATPTDTVLSVTSNSSITTSPTTGNVVIGINLANSNVYTVFQTVLKTALWATTAPGWVLDNTTAATASVFQASPSLLRRGRWFLTNSSSSFPFEIQDYAIGSASTTAYWKWKMQWRGNSGTWADFFEFDSDISWNWFSFTPGAAQSNSQPWTTRIQTINNTGSNSWTDYKFSWTRQVAVGADSSGWYNIFVKGGNYLGIYDGNNNQLFMYAYPTALVHSTWHGSFSQWVNAGSASNQAPPSKLTSYGRIWGKTVFISTNTTLTDGYYVIVANWDNNNICAGTPTYACNHWTNQGDCELRSWHGDCSWFAGNDCAGFNNEYGMGSCSGQAGCSVQTANCSWPGDQSTCESQNNSYWGTCAWVDAMPSCVWFDEGTCATYSGSGCTSNTFDCTTLNWNTSGCTGHGWCSINASSTCSWYTDTSTCNGNAPCSAVVDWDCGTLSDGGWDGTNCATKPECSYDSGTGVCSGFFFTSCGWDNSTCQGNPFDNCSGNYSSYSCTWNYNTGVCTGVYWAACTWSSNCTGVPYADCASEAGCSQSSGLNLTFPTEGSYSSSFYAGYKIYNQGSTATVTMSPNTDQSIVGTATIAPWARRVYDFAWVTVSCTTYSGTDSTTCTTGHSGCAWTACSAQWDEPSCTSVGWQCSWDGMACIGTGNCDGTWTPARAWIEF